MKILIVGAGPTGLTAGVELARHGIQAEIIDQRDKGSNLSRAVGINPRSLEILTPSGVTAKLLAQGIQYNSVCIYRKNKLWVTLPLIVAPVQHGYNFILGLPQDKTEEILHDTFVSLGGIISYSTKLVSVRQSDEQVIVTTEKDNQLSCDYLLGADGVHSLTRQSIGIECKGFKLPETWSIADVDASGWLHPNAATICLLPNGKIVVIIPLGDNRLRIISNTDNALAIVPFEIIITNVRREGQFIISINQVQEYNKGRVFLAGDAAHNHSPAGGRGMNLGIADSADFVAHLVEGTLSCYSQIRHMEGKHVIAGSEQIRKVMSSSNPIARALLLTGLKTISALPSLQRKMASKFLYG